MQGAAEITPQFGRGVATNRGVLSAALCIYASIEDSEVVLVF
jgi:hypothetical protein